jgi:peptidoglycan/xylan/chitin deacetylase (PgdA/CDA1 family)
MIVLWALVSLVLFLFLMSPLFRRRFRARGRILALHSLEPRSLDVSAVSLGTLLNTLDLCRERGLRIGSIEEAVRREDTIALTFDDGYSDLLQLLPLITEQRLPITVFMPTAFIGKPNTWDNFINRGKRRHLSAEEIKRLAAAGVMFGSHSHSHCDLSLLTDPEIEAELNESKRILETLTGRKVEYVGYPFGRCTHRVTAIARKLGFSRGFWSAPHQADNFNFGRTPLNKFDSPLTIRAKLTPGMVSGAEYLKSSIISRFSQLTPLLGRFSSRTSGR